jgi:2-hydroxyethylphosphonate dioxygenase
MHWLNTRKMTVKQAERLTAVPATLISQLLEGERSEVAPGDISALASVLNISPDDLTRQTQVSPSVIHMTDDEISDTGREVKRGGRHYYTYYSLPAPQDSVSPVLIDVLTTPGEELIQNNGHIEPAITVNLGPGDIVGEWMRGSHVDRRIFAANRDPEFAWISGDSYFEPPYLPHTYGLASLMPARVLSYTVRSNLEPLVHELNSWPESSVEIMRGRLQGKLSGGTRLLFEIIRHGYSQSTLESRLDLPTGSIADFVSGVREALSLSDLQRVAFSIGIDYRTLLDPVIVEDDLCRAWLTVADSMLSVRSFGAYTVASVAASTRCPRVCGFFMRVKNADLSSGLDLCYTTACHYFVNEGAVRLLFSEDTVVKKFEMKKGDAAWVGPFVQHAFVGTGNLLRMDSGDGLGCDDYLELSNTADVTDTIARAYRDLQPWTPADGT